MYTHNLDPVLLDLGLITIRWYSLAYIFGIVIGWWFGKRIIRHVIKNYNLKFNLEDFDEYCKMNIDTCKLQEAIEKSASI